METVERVEQHKHLKFSRVTILPTLQHYREAVNHQNEASERTSRAGIKKVCVFLWSRHCKVQCLLPTIFNRATTASAICRNYQATELWVFESQNFASSPMRKRRREVCFQLVTIERPVCEVKAVFVVYFSWFSLCLCGSCFSYGRRNAALKVGFQTLFWSEWIHATAGFCSGSTWWWCSE